MTLPAGANAAVQAALTTAMGLTVRLAAPGATAAATGGTKDPLAITLPLAAGTEGGTAIGVRLPPSRADHVAEDLASVLVAAQSHLAAIGDTDLWDAQCKAGMCIT